jgi:hypothetical protein
MLYIYRFLPLHRAVCYDNPNIEVLNLLLSVYPNGVHVLDNDGFKPLDRYVSICTHSSAFSLSKIICIYLHIFISIH